VKKIRTVIEKVGRSQRQIKGTEIVPWGSPMWGGGRVKKKTKLVGTKGYQSSTGRGISTGFFPFFSSKVGEVGEVGCWVGGGGEEPSRGLPASSILQKAADKARLTSRTT